MKCEKNLSSLHLKEISPSIFSKILVAQNYIHEKLIHEKIPDILIHEKIPDITNTNTNT